MSRFGPARELPRLEGAETARRALRILEQLGGTDEPLLLEEIVRRTELNRSAVYRLLRMLQEEGYLERAEGGGYLGGPRLIALAVAVIPNAANYEACRPLLRRLADRSGETCTLHRRAGDRAVLVTGAESSTFQPLRRVWVAGELTPLTRGSAGLAILSALTDDDIDKVVSAVAPDENESVLSELAAARRRGYALSHGGNHPGVAGIAAPVATTGLSVSVAGPDARWTDDRMIGFAPELRAAASEIAAVLGLG